MQRGSDVHTGVAGVSHTTALPSISEAEIHSGVHQSCSAASFLSALPLLQMGPWLQMVASPYLIVTLLLWSSLPGLWGQEFQFGPCRVEGVALPRLLEAFRTVKETMVSGL